MSRRIKVTPEELERAKIKIESLISRYKNWQLQLYNSVGAMRNIWSGEANQSFTNQINGFKNDFKALEELLEKYIEFIQKAAKIYKDAEAELVNEAKKLKTGN